MPSKRKERKDPAYIREQGKREAKATKKRKVSFSLTKLVVDQGQTIEVWDDIGLLGKLLLRIKYVGQFSVQEAIQNGSFKQYSKVDFPPNSKFEHPKHIGKVTWVVMHVTKNSKEVVAGFIEEDIYFIIFLDKDHEFWPSKLKNT